MFDTASHCMNRSIQCVLEERIVQGPHDEYPV
jgi:hypothetical protein